MSLSVRLIDYLCDFLLNIQEEVQVLSQHPAVLQVIHHSQAIPLLQVRLTFSTIFIGCFSSLNPLTAVMWRSASYLYFEHFALNYNSSAR